MNRGRDGRFGLFDNDPVGDAEAEIRDNPLLRPCGHCHAAPRQPCSSPSRQRGGRRLLHGLHDSRLHIPEQSTGETDA
jgi:hypothetical protein